EQDGVIEFADLTIEPEMDAGDRRRRELAQCRSQRRSGLSLRQHTPQDIKRNSQHQIVEFLFLSVCRHIYLGAFGSKRLHARAKLDLSTTRADVVASCAVQVGERHGWN